MAISPEALAELEKTRPDLVAQYRQKMAGTDEDLQRAQGMQGFGNVANSIGQAVTNYANANQSEVVLHNRMQDLGKSPTTRAAPQLAYDGSAIDKATSQALSHAKDAREQARGEFWDDQKLTDMGQARSDAALKRSDEQLVRDERARSMDPKSAESAAAREYLKAIGGEAVADLQGLDNLSEAQIYKIAPGIMHRQDLQDKIAARREEAAQRSADRAAMMAGRSSDKENARIDAGVTKAADKLGTFQDLNNSITRVEDQLGFPLEAYKDGKVNGKEVDLPGVSLPGIGRVTAFDSDARVLNSTMSEIFNKTLRDRSGAAVSNGEMERLKQEFQAGKFNTEAEMIGALQRYKAAATQAMKNAEAGFAPEILDTYEKRGGQTSRNKPAPMIKSPAEAEAAPSNEVRRRTKDGRVGVFNAETKEFLRYE